MVWLFSRREKRNPTVDTFLNCCSRIKKKKNFELLYNPLIAIPIICMLLSPSGEFSEWEK